MSIKIAAPLALALVVATGGSVAFAASNEAQAEASAAGGVKIGLADALAAVAAKDSNAVVEAALLVEGNIAVYQITTLAADGTEANYAVDAQTGAVVATIDAQQDEGDEADARDGADNQDGPRGDGDGETQDGAE